MQTISIVKLNLTLQSEETNQAKLKLNIKTKLYIYERDRERERERDNNTKKCPHQSTACIERNRFDKARISIYSQYIVLYKFYFHNVQWTVVLQVYRCFTLARV